VVLAQLALDTFPDDRGVYHISYYRINRGDIMSVPVKRQHVFPWDEFFFKYLYKKSCGDNNITPYTKVWYACESGSRVWGFASADSDYDMRFLYTKNIEEYAKLTPAKDTIEVSFEHNGIEIDAVGWDMRKYLSLLKKGNASAFEWVHSPRTYVEDGDWMARRIDLDDVYFSSRQMGFHYYGMARRHYNRYVKSRSMVVRKKYLYLLRALFLVDWYCKQEHVAPFDFVDLVTVSDMPWSIKEKALFLRDQKVREKEMGEHPTDVHLNHWIEEELDRRYTELRELPKFPRTNGKDPGYAPLNRLLFWTLGMTE